MAEIQELSKSFHHTADLLQKLNGRIQEHLGQRYVSKADVPSLLLYETKNSIRIEGRNEILLKKISDVEHQTNIISARFDELKKRLARHIYFRNMRKHKKNLGMLPKEKQRVGKEKSTTHIKLVDIIPEQRKSNLHIPVKEHHHRNYVGNNSNIDLLYSQIASNTLSSVPNQSHIAYLCSSKFPKSLTFETLLDSSQVSELNSKGIQKSVETQTDFSVLCGHCQMIPPFQSEDKHLQSTVNSFDQKHLTTNLETNRYLKINEVQSSCESVLTNFVQGKSLSEKVGHACGTHETSSKLLSELDEIKIGHHINKPVNASNGECFEKSSTHDTDPEVSGFKNKNVSKSDVCDFTSGKTNFSVTNENCVTSLNPKGYEKFDIQVIPSVNTESKAQLLHIECILPSNQTKEYIKENNVEKISEIADLSVSTTSSSYGHLAKENITGFNQVPQNSDCLGPPSDFKNPNIVFKASSATNVKNSQEESKVSGDLSSVTSVAVSNEKVIDLPGHVENIPLNHYVEIKEVGMISASDSKVNVLEQDIDVIEKPCDSFQELNGNMQRQSTEKKQNSMGIHKRDEVLVANSGICDKTPTVKEQEVTEVNSDKCFEDNIGIKRKACLVRVTPNTSKCKENFSEVLQKTAKMGMEPSPNLPTDFSETDDEEEEEEAEVAGSNVPFTATAAFQRLAGNIPIENKMQMKTVAETDTESDDEIEKALSAALNPSITGTSIDHGTTDCIPVVDKPLASTFNEKTSGISPSDSPKHRSSLKPTSKIKGKLSKATISALGLSSDSDIDPGSSGSKTKTDDSDEFDFYD